MTLRPRASTSPGSCVSTLARRTVWQGQLRGRGLSEEYSHPFKRGVNVMSEAFAQIHADGITPEGMRTTVILYPYSIQRKG